MVRTWRTRHAPSSTRPLPPRRILRPVANGHSPGRPRVLPSSFCRSSSRCPILIAHPFTSRVMVMSYGTPMHATRLYNPPHHTHIHRYATAEETLLGAPDGGPGQVVAIVGAMHPPSVCHTPCRIVGLMARHWKGRRLHTPRDAPCCATFRATFCATAPHWTVRTPR